jgi:hypothetical protein
MERHAYVTLRQVNLLLAANVGIKDCEEEPSSDNLTEES